MPHHGGDNYARSCMCEWAKKAGDEALERSKGGLNTKLHAVVDALGNPLRFLFTGGQVADYTQAKVLLDGFCYDFSLMDKAYDNDAILQIIEENGMIAVIPPKSNCLFQRNCDFFCS